MKFKPSLPHPCSFFPIAPTLVNTFYLRGSKSNTHNIREVRTLKEGRWASLGLLLLFHSGKRGVHKKVLT